MSKACDTEEQAQETVEHYKAKGEEAFTKNLVINIMFTEFLIIKF
jgi:hypothetical protein